MQAKAKIPGPNKYMKETTYFKNLLGKTPGAYMKEPSRVSFFEEAELQSKAVPASNKYEPPPMEVLRPRSAKTTFYPREKPKFNEKDKSRFKNARIAPVEKNNDPSSVTYRKERSYDIMTIPNPQI